MGRTQASTASEHLRPVPNAGSGNAPPIPPSGPFSVSDYNVDIPKQQALSHHSANSATVPCLGHLPDGQKPPKDLEPAQHQMQSKPAQPQEPVVTASCSAMSHATHSSGVASGRDTHARGLQQAAGGSTRPLPIPQTDAANAAQRRRRHAESDMERSGKCSSTTVTQDSKGDENGQSKNPGVNQRTPLLRSHARGRQASAALARSQCSQPEKEPMARPTLIPTDMEHTPSAGHRTPRVPAQPASGSARAPRAPRAPASQQRAQLQAHDQQAPSSQVSAAHPHSPANSSRSRKEHDHDTGSVVPQPCQPSRSSTTTQRPLDTREPPSKAKIFAFDHQHGHDADQETRVNQLRAAWEDYWEARLDDIDLQAGINQSLQDLQMQRQDEDMLSILRALQPDGFAPGSQASPTCFQEQKLSAGHEAEPSSSHPESGQHVRCMPAVWLLLDLLQLVEPPSIYAAAKGDDTATGSLLQMIKPLNYIDTSPNVSRHLSSAAATMCDLMLHVHGSEGVVDQQESYSTEQDSWFPNTDLDMKPEGKQSSASSPPSKLESFLTGHRGALLQASNSIAALVGHEGARVRLAKTVAPLIMDMGRMPKRIGLGRNSSSDVQATLSMPKAFSLVAPMFGDDMQALEQWLMASGHWKEFGKLQLSRQHEGWQKLQQSINDKAGPSRPSKKNLRQRAACVASSLAAGARGILLGPPQEDCRGTQATPEQHQPNQPRPTAAPGRFVRDVALAHTAIQQAPTHAQIYADGPLQWHQLHANGRQSSQSSHSGQAPGSWPVPSSAGQGLADVHRLTINSPQQPVFWSNGLAMGMTTPAASAAAVGARPGAPSYSQMLQNDLPVPEARQRAHGRYPLGSHMHAMQFPGGPETVGHFLS